MAMRPAKKKQGYRDHRQAHAKGQAPFPAPQGATAGTPPAAAVFLQIFSLKHLLEFKRLFLAICFCQGNGKTQSNPIFGKASAMPERECHKRLNVSKNEFHSHFAAWRQPKKHCGFTGFLLSFPGIFHDFHDLFFNELSHMSLNYGY